MKIKLNRAMFYNDKRYRAGLIMDVKESNISHWDKEDYHKLTEAEIKALEKKKKGK